MPSPMSIHAVRSVLKVPLTITLRAVGGRSRITSFIHTLIRFGVNSISAVALGLLTWRLFMQSLYDLQTSASTVVLGLPNAALSFVLTFFAGLSTVVVIMQIWRTCQPNWSIE